MNRRLVYERKFPVEQYGNISFTDEISNLPEEVLFNKELLDKVRYLQMLDVELAYRVYVELYKRSKTLAAEELAAAIAFLEEEKEKTLLAIESILSPNKQGTEEKELEKGE